MEEQYPFWIVVKEYLLGDNMKRVWNILEIDYRVGIHGLKTYFIGCLIF